jgi:hypothetical protein
MELFLIGLGVLGAVGAIPVIVVMARSFRRFKRARRVLDFSRRNRVDVVLPESGMMARPEGSGVLYSRPLTGYGPVRGLAFCARAVARHYQGAEVGVYIDNHLFGPLGGDLVALGGPSHNSQAREFLYYLTENYDIDVHFDEKDSRLDVCAPGEKWYDTRSDPIVLNGDAYPSSDVGLIVAINSEDGGGRKRRILCAGVTTYGSGVAADYLFSVMSTFTRKTFRSVFGNGKRKRQPREFLVVVRASFNRGEHTGTTWPPVFSCILTRSTGSTPRS